jgi:hypothetical protein
MAVRAQHAQIFNPMIVAAAVDMVDLHDKRFSEPAI